VGSNVYVHRRLATARKFLSNHRGFCQSKIAATREAHVKKRFFMAFFMTIEQGRKRLLLQPDEVKPRFVAKASVCTPDMRYQCL